MILGAVYGIAAINMSLASIQVALVLAMTTFIDGQPLNLQEIFGLILALIGASICSTAGLILEKFGTQKKVY